jgi:hypothetical protein
MRSFVAFLAACACLHGASVRAQDAYAAILLQYFTGDADAAIAQLKALNIGQIHEGVDAFNTTRAPMVLPGAAAMHTEAAIRRTGGLDSMPHLEIATAIVEFGEPGLVTSNTSITIAPQYARPVSDDFRRMWYCTVITGLEGAGMLRDVDRYLSHALKLYPGHAEIQLLAGVAEEMRASPRTGSPKEGDRRKALTAAERYYRAVIAAEPTRLEARLRLARVLQVRNQLSEARTLLQPLVSVKDLRMSYLAGLFLGGIEDELKHPDAAFALYERAAAQVPIAQAARLAASEIQHRSGDRAAAADAVPAAVGAANEFDPWWTYVFGEYWRAELLLNALRRLRTAS